MFSPPAPSTHRATARWLVWVLALALVLHGYSGALLQMLGPTHSHHAGVAASAAPQPAALKHGAWLATAKEWFRPLRTWRDDLHARSHAAGWAVPHQHSAFERHHHDIDDPSVISLDGSGAAGEALADGAGTATAASGALPLAPCLALVVPQPMARPCTWPRSIGHAWVDAVPRQPERPPRA